MADESQTESVPRGTSDSGNSAKNTDSLTPQQRRLANLRPFQPGQSGNPSGRPKRKPITDAYIRLLNEPIPGDKEGRTFADALAQKILKEALNGKVPAASEITDRVEGKVTLPISGSEGGPLAIEFRSIVDEDK